MTRLTAHVLTFTISLIAVAAMGGGTTQGQTGCAPTVNPIVCENFQAGAPPEEWDVVGAGDSTIQGFATAMSVAQGEIVRFKVKTTANSYRLDIYRLGYYDGMGARKIATVSPSVVPQTQPACLTTAATGLIDCGNWAESASWLVPTTATSGIYFARLVRTDTLGASHIMFVVRDDNRASDLLFQTSDTTWQAYNSYGGNSLYVGAPAGRAYKVSYNRPLIVRGTPGGPQESGPFNTEYPMVRWLEANGYNVSYTSGVDTDRRGAELLEHKVFLSVGHDEYWSAQQRARVEAARDAGVHLAFFSGNEVFWKTRWENSTDASATPYRTLVCYKETAANAKIDPTAAWTGTWRDPRFSPPADGGRPENALTGTLFTVNGIRNDAIKVPAAEGKMRFWRNTTIANLAAGQTATLPTGTLGYEWDEDLDNGSRPAGLMQLSSTTLDVTPMYLQDYGSSYGGGIATHHLTLYRAGSGALVFGAGTVQWPWGLDATHDRAGTPIDVRMQQATVNLFADMEVQPGSLRAGLVATAASTDTLAPASVITSPANGAPVPNGVPVTISGTATEQGGGAIAAVEVSTDDGATWRLATGRASWSYVWTPSNPGTQPAPATLRSRGVDDTGNIEAPGAGVTVTIAAAPGLVAAYGFEEADGSVVADQSGNANAGAISGATWTASGKFGSALSFDGVNDLITINDAESLDATTLLTMEAWVYPTALSGWRSAIVKEAQGHLAYGLYPHDNGPFPASYVFVNGLDRRAGGTTQVPLNTWTHLASTYDGASLRLFVNAIEVRNVALSGLIATSTSPLRIGGNAIWGEYFQGMIDEVRVYRRALTQSQIQTDMAMPVGGTAVPDTTFPTASMTAPANGSVVAATITLSANASDNRSVVGVRFLLDGSPIGIEDTTAPYTLAWDSRTTTDGGHVLAARARDAAGNTTVSSSVSITVANAPDTTPPTVSMTAPANGSTATGTVTVSAAANDNVAVAGVQFLIDGAPLGAEDTTSPFSIAWDSIGTPNGSHQLSARARDASGNPATSAAIGVTVSNIPAPNGLVAAYAFSEGTGTSAADLSNNGRTATISGAAWTTAGRFGNALSFDGVNDLATVADANALDLTTGMTLEAWVNPTSLSGWRSVILKEATGALAYSIYANDNAPHPASTVIAGGVEVNTPGSSALPLGTWSHLAATYDGTALRLFVNGVQVNTRAASGSLSTSTGALRIGGNAVWGEHFQGLIDEVRIFNRARTQTEIQSDMNSPVDAGPADAVPPTAPSGLTAAGGAGTATLSWTAATDNVGVANYNVHRSGTSGFTPSAANRIAQPASTSYANTGVTAGTYYYLVTAQDAAGNVGPASNQASAVVTGDAIAPAVSITAPTAGATVSGNVMVSANASDNVAVAGVQFLLDGVPLGAEDTASPYSITWDSRAATNGSHTLTARARDAAGNQTTSGPVAVTTSNQGPPGLVAAYGFNEGSGTTTADASGNANTATIAGAAWNVSGRFGRALSFDGVSDLVTIPDASSLDLTTGMTLEAWLNPSALSGWRSALLKEASGGLSYSLYAHDDAPRPAATVNTGGIDQSTAGTVALALNTWTHLAATYDGATLRLFVNGVQVSSRAVTGSLITSTGAVRIGGNTIWGEYFSGLIDEVRIYNRALTATEIQSDMNAPVGG
jgi:hypothetical protein